MNQLVLCELEIALFNGNPLEDGKELNGSGYDRADFGIPNIGLYGNVWGIVNRDSICFPKAEEPWTITHLGIYVKHYDIMINMAPVGDVILYFDTTVSALAGETKLVPIDHSIAFAPARIFMLGNLIGEAFDLGGQSKYPN